MAGKEKCPKSPDGQHKWAGGSSWKAFGKELIDPKTGKTYRMLRQKCQHGCNAYKALNPLSRKQKIHNK